MNGNRMIALLLALLLALGSAGSALAEGVVSEPVDEVVGEAEELQLGIAAPQSAGRSEAAENTVDNDTDSEGFTVEDGVLTKYSGPGGMITIPESVTRIGENVFADCASLTGVVIPNTVTSIGSGAFCWCDNLVSVEIPGSVQSIGNSAFYNCRSLKYVSLGEGIRSIYDYAFRGCNSLESIEIPAGVSQTTGAFYECKGLTSVKLLAQEMVSLSAYAFYGCSSLTSVTIEARSEVYINRQAFEGCYNLKTINVHCNSAAMKWARENGYTAYAEDHTPVKDRAVAPTLTRTGKTEGSHCKLCGEVLVRQRTIDKLINIKNCTVSDIPDKVYSGKPFKPTPEVRNGWQRLTKGKDYTLSYKNNTNVGVATVTITGKGLYGGKASKTFIINPKAVKLSSVTTTAKKLTAKWTKGVGITGYQLEYGTSADFVGAKSVTVKAAVVSKTIGKLATGTKYFVRIRTYKKIGRKTYYSAWSKAKAVKVK